MTDEPYASFDISKNVACGITESGENRCWSWYDPYYPVDADTLVADGRYDHVAVGNISACWWKDGEPVQCLPDPICSGQEYFDPAECTGPPDTVFTAVSLSTAFTYCGITPSGSLECWGRYEPYAGLDLPPLAFIDGIYVLDTEGRLWSADPVLPFLEGDVPFTEVAHGDHLLVLDEAGGLTNLVPHPEDYEYTPGCTANVPAGPYSGIASDGAMCVLFPAGGAWCCNDSPIESRHYGDLLTFFKADTG